MAGKSMRVLVATAALGLFIAACSSDSKGSSSSSGSCPVDALDKATGTVEITMWHAMPRENEATLQKLAGQFNSSQSKVKVNLINQTTYDDVLKKFQTGLSTGDLPDIAQMEDIDLQTMIDSQAIVPMQACVKAADYTVNALKRMTDYFTVDGELQAMPFNTSTPNLYYDQSDFQKADLDPANPPKTLDEVYDAAKKLKAAGIKTPMQLKLDSWYLEQWQAKANELYVNNENGRKSRATEMLVGNTVGQQVFDWLAKMHAEGLAVGSGRDAFDNLLALANGDSSMTLDTSAALGTAYTVIESGGVGDKAFTLGVAPMPTAATGGGNSVGGAGLYLMKKSSPEKQAAAWQWLKFLNAPENQATWAVGTGYIPISEAATQQPSVQQLWQQKPFFKVAFDQLTQGPESAATAGAVMGPFVETRNTLIDAMGAVLNNGAPPQPTLQAAVKTANGQIAEYNSRVGK